MQANIQKNTDNIVQKSGYLVKNILFVVFLMMAVIFNLNYLLRREKNKKKKSLGFKILLRFDIVATRYHIHVLRTNFSHSSHFIYFRPFYFNILMAL